VSVTSEDSERAAEEMVWLLERARSLLSVVRAGESGRRVAELEEEVRALELRLASAEQQNERLMRLYVATYQLHATLNPPEVLEAISQIVTDLVGADRFALLLKDPQGGRAAVVLCHGLGEEIADRSLIRFAGRQYAGGDALVDATLEDGRLRTGGEGGPVAVVPLNVNGRTVGALVILRLLGHRRELGAEDRETLDLIAAHAAAALFAAQSYASADRKLRTLAGILEPTRRSA
jgi:nitrate/nitrite-specific signal transduction histidine kinase